MPSSNDPIKTTDNEIERIENLEIATNLVLYALLINAVRTLVALLIAQWVLRREGTE